MSDSSALSLVSCLVRSFVRCFALTYLAADFSLLLLRMYAKPVLYVFERICIIRCLR